MDAGAEFEGASGQGFKIQIRREVQAVVDEPFRGGLFAPCILLVLVIEKEVIAFLIVEKEIVAQLRPVDLKVGFSLQIEIKAVPDDRLGNSRCQVPGVVPVEPEIEVQPLLVAGADGRLILRDLCGSEIIGQGVIKVSCDQSGRDPVDPVRDVEQRLKAVVAVVEGQVLRDVVLGPRSRRPNQQDQPQNGSPDRATPGSRRPRACRRAAGSAQSGCGL